MEGIWIVNISIVLMGIYFLFLWCSVDKKKEKKVEEVIRREAQVGFMDEKSARWSRDNGVWKDHE